MAKKRKAASPVIVDEDQNTRSHRVNVVDLGGGYIKVFLGTPTAADRKVIKKYKSGYQFRRNPTRKLIRYLILQDPATLKFELVVDVKPGKHKKLFGPLGGPPPAPGKCGGPCSITKIACLDNETPDCSTGVLTCV